jgi:protein-S-isoprenylcysteine O-methyltransferase Ste14
MVAAGAGTAYLVGYCLQQPLTFPRMFGLILTAVSFALWMTARIQLGRSFSIAPKATALVTRGLYSKIRNPIYVFSATWIAGLALALGHPIAVLLVVPVIPMQIARARREARVLEESFGEEYRKYRRKTWF